MADYALYQVDAFADRPFAGNQACVMPLEAWLPDALLQQVANENNVAETAFLLPDATGEADYELRWFTPAVEVALCGHATLASGHVVLALQPGRARVTFRTRKSGILAVERAGEGLLTLELSAWTPAPAAPGAVSAALGGAPDAVLDYPGGYVVAVYRTAAEVRALRPDTRAIAAAGNILAIASAPGEDTDILSRVFAPGAGIDEDPVTGAAHAILTPYWAARLGRPVLTALQASARTGRMVCELAGGRVRLTGRCVTTIEGVMRF